MTLDDSMSKSATSYATILAQRGGLKPSSSSDGENLAMGCSQNGLSAEAAVNMWLVVI